MNHIPIPPRPRWLCCAAMLLVGLTACGQSGQTSSTQVAAKVGSEEISVHQINQVLRGINAVDAPQDEMQKIKQGILEKLIDQELAVEQATAAKLHRSPEVVTQIEAARREILVRAYMQQVGSGQPKPNAHEISQYYNEHPELFAQRRIYTVQEVIVPPAAGIENQLRRLAALERSVEEASTWLQSQNIKFNAGGATRAAEQIPLELLAQMHQLKDGQSVVLPSRQAITLMRITSTQSVPLSATEAAPRIEAFLTNQRMAQAVANHLKQLRGSTKIAYLGDFAKAGDPVSGGATVTTPTASTQPASPQTAIEKGVAGMR
ncbi:MAG: EpsD family peptidyl-prolyl cis-trans isomerase [Burkholderiales bacterium]